MYGQAHGEDVGLALDADQVLVEAALQRLLVHRLDRARRHRGDAVRRSPRWKICGRFLPLMRLQAPPAWR